MIEKKMEDNTVKKIMLIDTNYGFTSDIESRLILDDIDGIEIVTKNNINTIHEAIEKERPDELLIASSIINSHPNWDFGIPVKTYAKNTEGIIASQDKGFMTYGLINGAGELIQAISSNRILKLETPSGKNKFPNETDLISGKSQVSDVNQNTKGINPFTQKKPDLEEVFEDIVEETLIKENMQKAVHKSKKKNDITISANMSSSPESNDGIRSGISSRGSNDLKARLAEARKREEEERRKKEAAAKNRHLEEATAMVNRDMGNVKMPAKLITVYSAKGGVGKTSLACELSTYLALTAHGRGRYKVCIADYNIDFGDVINTLDYDANRACMTIWAADIRERINAGESPEDISYTEGQISAWLQKNEQTGLYALLAPFTNEDSMDISEIELEVMLRNLVDNGGFDFVVCDTGNNTRDSSFIPLEKADDIILVLTQSVNTANCNVGLIETMRKIDFDMSKVRTVINMAQPAKSVGISVDEVIEAFINPNTGKPFEVLSVLKYTNDEKTAGNMGIPLVLKSSHEFTRGISSIAQQIIGDNFVLEAPKKKGIFAKLFKK